MPTLLAFTLLDDLAGGQGVGIERDPLDYFVAVQAKSHFITL